MSSTADVDGRSPTTVASADGHDVGLLVAIRHSPYAAEIHVMAVRPEWHRQGIGRRLVEHVESGLTADGVEFLKVKTLSARHPDAGYEKTRAFHATCGFRPLEEFPILWGSDDPALQMIKAVRARISTGQGQALAGRTEADTGGHPLTATRPTA